MLILGGENVHQGRDARAKRVGWRMKMSSFDDAMSRSFCGQGMDVVIECFLRA